MATDRLIVDRGIFSSFAHMLQGPDVPMLRVGCISMTTTAPLPPLLGSTRLTTPDQGADLAAMVVSMWEGLGKCALTREEKLHLLAVALRERLASSAAQEGVRGLANIRSQPSST